MNSESPTNREDSGLDRGVDVDVERFDEVDAKHSSVARFLDSHRFDALLLQNPCNLAWFTAGADFSSHGSSEAKAFLFITGDARVVVTSNEHSDYLFEQEIPRLGFQLKQRAWQETRSGLLRDLCRGRTVASDCPFENTIDVTPQLAGMRLPLGDFECQRLRRLGQRVAHAVEATARNCRKGQMESEIAGEIAHRLLKHCIVPEQIQVWGDGRHTRFRHAAFGSQPVDRYCSMTVKARHRGLHCSVTRMMYFGDLPAELKSQYEKVLLVLATGLFFSQDGWEMSETWKRVKRIFEKFGHPDEWQHAQQAEISGYRPTEMVFSPESGYRLREGMPVFWRPSIGSSLVGDSMLVGKNRYELLTPCESWPETVVTVKGNRLTLPGILKRSKEKSSDSSIFNAADSLTDFSLDDSSFFEEVFG